MDLGNGAKQVRIALTGLNPGQAMALYFDLIGFGALGSEVAIDDVHFVYDEPPVAQADTVGTTVDIPVTFDPRGNDSSPKGLPLTVELVTSPSHGSVNVEPDGRVTYTPNAGFVGSDSFEYRVTDGELASLPVLVTVTVSPVNTAPVAVGDGYGVGAGGTLTMPAPGVLGNDTDAEGDVLTAVLVVGPAHGTLTFNTDGSFTYTPNAGYSGTDSFTYAANDGTLDSEVATVTLTVTATPVNTAPVAGADGYSVERRHDPDRAAPGVLGNDTDAEGDVLTAVLVVGPAHGTLTLNADGSFTYTPNADYSGTDSFTYAANDGTLDSEVATVTLTVTPPRSTPPRSRAPTATASMRTRR